MKKGFNKFLLYLVGVMFLTSSPGYAYAQLAGGGAAKPASAGTLMAAVMEQVGYHAQSQILTQLNEQMQWAAALIYLGVLVSILITVGLMGNYKAALWILVGPTMFVYASGVELGGQKNTIKGASVEWRFGAFHDKEVTDDQGKMLKDSENGKATPAEVSFVFHKYNELISELCQYLITVFTSGDTKVQMLFMARQRTMEELFNQKADVPGLMALGQYFMINCGREVAYASYVAQGLRDPAKKADPYWKTARDEYCRLFIEEKPFSPGPWQDYLFTENVYKGIYYSKQANEGRGRRQEDGIITCQEMWEGLMHGARNAIYSREEAAAATAIMPQAWKVSGRETFDKVYADLKTKFTTADENTTTEKKNTETVNCVPGVGNAGKVQSDADLLTGFFGAFLLKKVIIGAPYANMLSRVTDRDHGITSDQTIPVGTEPQAKQATMRRTGEHQYGEARRYEALMLVTVLPYLQGMILYVLAVTYPFFCIMLLLPGQAGNFFVWMALWAWAKSWDVGWALVMVADEILWQLMPKTAFINPESAIDNTNAISMLKVAFDGDPSYNTATYWLLLSGMISAVPVITANMILGTKKAVSGVLLSGFSALADPIAAGAADWAGGGQGRVNTVRRDSAAIQSNQAKTGAAAGSIEQSRKAMNGTNGQGKLDEVMNKSVETGKDNQARIQADKLGAEKESLEKKLGK